MTVRPKSFWQRFLGWTSLLTLPRALLIAVACWVIWSLVFVLNEPQAWQFILLMAPLTFGPALGAGVCLWAAFAALRRVFLQVRNS